MKSTRRLAPRARWVQLDGPPGHGKSPVWEHPNGARLHSGGCLRLPGPARTTVDWCDPAYGAAAHLAARMQPGPRRIRRLLVWAEIILTTPHA